MTRKTYIDIERYSVRQTGERYVAVTIRVFGYFLLHREFEL
jgi:hypothetical protein